MAAQRSEVRLVDPALLAHLHGISLLLFLPRGTRGSKSPTVSCCSQALLSLGASASSHKMALQRHCILWKSFLYNLNALMGAKL